MKTKALVAICILAVLLVSCAPSNHFVVYSASSDEKSVNLYLVNTDSGEDQQLTKVDYANYPSWSADGKHIVFASGDGLYSLSRNNAELTKIIDTPKFEIHPDWSPDGTKIAFISQDTQNISLYDLMVVNVDGTGLTTLANNLGDYDFSFSWSPDGKKLTFSKLVHETREIVTVNVDGTGLKQVTNLSVPIYSAPIQPAWSPDGKKIAFVTRDLFIINSDGTELKKLAEKTEGIPTFDAPLWSPDGKYIACRNGDNIVLVHVVDGQITTISGEHSIGGYTWSPQGDQLAYFVNYGKLGIEKIDINSMQRVLLIKDLGFYPWQTLAWQP